MGSGTAGRATWEYGVAFFAKPVLVRVSMDRHCFQSTRSAQFDAGLAPSPAMRAKGFVGEARRAERRSGVLTEQACANAQVRDWSLLDEGATKSGLLRRSRSAWGR